MNDTVCASATTRANHVVRPVRRQRSCRKLIGMVKTVIVVPCFNEAKRLQLHAFASVRGVPDFSWLFVDDGSRDDTAQLLRKFCDEAEQGRALLRLPRNVGKGEAVRQGMNHALAHGAIVTGYFDADLATPVDEMLRIIEVLRQRDKTVAMGSRVRLLGTDIQRSAFRHYLGRIFATCASLTLGMPVYDTQCGAKALRGGAALRAALADPFLSRWGFDIELLGRLRIGAPAAAGLSLDEFVEVPVRQWHDVSGSQVKLADFPRLAWDLWRIGGNLRRRRRAVSRARSP
jgi:glycosyltransferase involved in cell wall biosynthesis